MIKKEIKEVMEEVEIGRYCDICGEEINDIKMYDLNSWNCFYPEDILESFEICSTCVVTKIKPMFITREETND